MLTIVALFCLYHALKRSELNYSCIVYSFACKSVLRTLDAVHHAGFCQEAFHILFVQSLYVKVEETTLFPMPMKFAMNYACVKVPFFTRRPCF